ncbi:RND transporter [Marinomonas sp. UCMA 3892]|uniref:TolC family protein n=1 Tax=unclassified Marinomonas TaxID=196814 RepID=UPI00146D656D|nr:TolC family protein [Marinomonas sp. UCMA 3892]NLU98198.1 RND transporter [Marinomonas sp. UCMA 3892]
MQNRPLRYLGLLFVVLTLAACSSNEPRKHFASLAQQELDAISNKKTSQWDALDTVAPASYLTDLIQDPVLDELIKTALESNPNIQSTLLTLQSSLWELKSTQSSQLPSVDASVSSKKSKDSDTNYSADINVSWQLDVWGKLANTEQAASKTLASDEALYQASRDTLVANVMKTWLSLTAKQHAINIEQQRLELLESNEKLIIQRFKNGLDNLEKMDEARTSTSQSRANLVEYKEDLETQKRELKLLVGTTEPLALAPNIDYPRVSLTLDELPNQSLQRRPDLKSAYLSIEAADLKTTLAYKNMLPSINLSAALSQSADSPRVALFTSPVWSLMTQLTQPLYQGGKLKAEREIAKLNTAKAYQAYRNTLLTAVNEVDNAIGQEKVLQQQVSHIREALESSRSNLAQYQKKYRSGLVQLSDLIAAQKTTFDLEAQLDKLIFNHLSNRITLGVALGLGVKQP